VTADHLDVRSLGELFDGHSDERIRALGIDALRRWYASLKTRNQPPISFSIHGELAPNMLPLLCAEKPSFKADHAKLKEAFLFSPNQWGEPIRDRIVIIRRHFAGLRIGRIFGGAVSP